MEQNMTSAQQKKRNVQTAIYLGVLCAIAYLAGYITRNTLSACAPQMQTQGITETVIGGFSSVYFISYAIGQLLNGIIGDKIKARTMISLGLLLSGVSNYIFTVILDTGASEMWATVAYAATGFFLAMIYAPMTKVVAENTEPIHAVRCSLGYTFSSLFGSPFAGVLAAAFAWQTAFFASSLSLVLMAGATFLCFIALERSGRVKYNQFHPMKEQEGKTEKSGTIRVLIKHKIVRFTFVALLTGIVRTTVVFWLPTYFKQYLHFSDESSSLIFTVTTLVISLSAFLAVAIYEVLRRKINLTMLSMFGVSAISFLLSFLIPTPLVNIIFITLAVLFANCASNILWSVYCPSLRDTGRVSAATGFLDFVSYMAAAVSSSIFANAAVSLGWGILILVWFALMALGVVVCIPFENRFRKA